MPLITLARDDAPPLTFHGRLLWTGQRPPRPVNGLLRWLHLSLYAPDAGGGLLHLTWTNHGGQDTHRVEQAASVAQAWAFLRAMAQAAPGLPPVPPTPPPG